MVVRWHVWMQWHMCMLTKTVCDGPVCVKLQVYCMFHCTFQLEQRAIPYWLRYVYAPGVTDSDADVADLITFAADKHWMQAVEVLPYHRLGVEKWHQLGLEYPMEQQHVPSADETRRFVERLQQGGLTVLCAVPTS